MKTMVTLEFIYLWSIWHLKNIKLFQKNWTLKVSVSIFYYFVFIINMNKYYFGFMCQSYFSLNTYNKLNLSKGLESQQNMSAAIVGKM